jgi:glycosyltransferase involved in cell wall biosynthesis
MGSAGTTAPRVVIAHDYLTQRGGAERVALAMLGAFPGARIVTTMYDPDATFPEFRNHHVETAWPNRLKALRDDPRRALPVLAPAVSGHRIDDADVVLVSSSGWAHGFRTDAPKLVYCHTPPRWLHCKDDYAMGLPAHARLALRTLEPALRTWDRRAASTATKYLANSTMVQRRIADAYGIGADLLHPPVAIDPDGEQEPVPGLEPGFLLNICRPRGYKNTRLVCEAVAELPDARLVLVGGLPDPDRTWPSNIVGVRGLSDAQMRWLYANAAGLVGLSHEDFGLTPVEGYSFGLPSVLLRAGGYLDSSVEGLTTVFVDAVERGQVRTGIEELLATDWDRDAIIRHGQRFSLQSFQDALQREVARLVPATARPAPPTGPMARRLPDGMVAAVQA